jgi:hypothetical protein
MSITTEEAEQLAARHNKESHAWASDGATHDLAEFHAKSAAGLFYLAAERDALRRERDGLDALIKRMHEQDVRAIEAWQAAHPGSALTWPSSVRLSAWCIGEVASVTAERDALRAELDQAVGCIEDAKAEREQLQAEIEKLRAAMHDLAGHVWRGDWDKLKPETRELLGEKQ